MQEPITSIDPTRYREVMGHYPTGVTVVTGLDDAGEPVGMVVGTFTSVSLDPPLVAFLPTTSSRTFARLRTSKAFCINVLAHDQAGLCRTMASSGPEKFSNVDWSPSPLGAPMLFDAVAHIHCFPTEAIEAGDHYIQLCAVSAMDVSRQVTPLLFFQGGYGGFSPHGMTARGDGELIAGLRLADLARTQIEALADELRCEAAVMVAANEDELTTAAVAHGGRALMRELIGERLPMKPPLGEAYMAWAPETAIERWLAFAGKDPETAKTLQNRLAKIRDRGYAAWEAKPADTATRHDLERLMDKYATGGLTPAAERSLLARMAELMPYYSHSGEFEDSQTYDIAGLMTPVLSSDGNIAMLLRLAQLPPASPGRDVKTWIARLRSAASAVEAILHGNPDEPDSSAGPVQPRVLPGSVQSTADLGC
ncbi:flavin reductase [Streptomyces jeddahensis]|uniref:Flavin-dependent monooxygenase, reductase subunit HsaB n=1 Tax=Streptomyces jeddahensis TaxID=1716141 RepID=A0A177HZJ4_9ACTN|nr:flavin reductase [Streptomyces jeddahensis]OAH16206.1 flavin-dependent monooxygenase, reductase subunit HsaB [Streptomyces jeddahensis]